VAGWVKAWEWPSAIKPYPAADATISRMNFDFWGHVALVVTYYKIGSLCFELGLTEGCSSRSDGTPFYIKIALAQPTNDNPKNVEKLSPRIVDTPPTSKTPSCIGWIQNREGEDA
jgi:hypothetical protein